MHLSITICATQSYTYAMIAQARRLQSAILDCPRFKTGSVILVGDGCEENKKIHAFYEKILPEGWRAYRIDGDFTDGLDNYDHPAQLIIARMRSVAFTEARRLGSDYCLSMDSDVLPQSNSILCMLQAIEFDNGYYSVAQCPYPSQGGGDFLGGRGTQTNPILPDAFDADQILSDELTARVSAHRKLLLELNGEGNEEWEKERVEIAKLYKDAPRKGDVFFLNSNSGVKPFVADLKARLEKDGASEEVMKSLDEIADRWKPTGFRRRGWHSAAYPAIGQGAIVPIDWVGFGCTMMNHKALSLAQFDGYDGGGTEDLYIVWKRWHRVGLRMASIAHSPADHVIRNKDEKTKGKFVLLQAYHESGDAECVGHLRCEPRPWFQQVDGEVALKSKKDKEHPDSTNTDVVTAQSGN